MPTRIIDLTHTIEESMSMFPGLPAPKVVEFVSRRESAPRYAEGTTFVIHRYELMANTGTYMDAPSHRYADGADLSGILLRQVVDVPIVVLDIRRAVTRGKLAVDPGQIEQLQLKDRALLLHSGWDRKWNTPGYLDRCPYLTRGAAECLLERGCKVFGTDSWNADDIQDGTRPAHTVLLKSGVPIIEHMCNVGLLPRLGARLHAAPLPIVGGSSVPVRAYAVSR